MAKPSVPRRNTGNGHTVSPGNEVAAAVQTAHNDAPVDAEQDFVAESSPTFIDDVLPRAGMAQKWIRVSVNGKDDARNISKMFRLGWKPRAVDTVPGGFNVPTYKHPQLGGVVGVGDLILCEMPESRAALIRKSYQQKLDTQLNAVYSQADSETGGTLQANRKTKAETSRTPQFADE